MHHYQNNGNFLPAAAPIAALLNAPVRPGNPQPAQLVPIAVPAPQAIIQPQPQLLPQQQAQPQPQPQPQFQQQPNAPPQEDVQPPEQPAASNSHAAQGAGLPRRNKTIRRAVAIRDGKLVIDLDVSPMLTDPSFNKYSSGEEFTKLRYTAVTCDPNEYLASGYQLRQTQYGRQTELFIVVTMYNEDDILFTRTMLAINKNIQHMCNKKTGFFGGETGWQKIVVCIVADGRNKVSKEVLKVLTTMGVYQDGVCVPRFMNKDTQAHVFEYTSQILVSDSLNIRTHREHGVVPMQLLFVLKEKNQKKINSHRWFFNAFSAVLRPNICVLLDVGTKPKREAIYRLWRVFDSDENVGGCCGEIAVEYKSIFHLMTPIIAAQNFEYKMSNILDKPLESWFGYISVLPGAFSAYRYRALLGRPLEQYFKGETLHNSSDVFAANMYLAEDRILCFELVAKRNERWSLEYEKSSIAFTDVPDNFPEFISQRRRWLNGSTFALLYSLGNVMQVYSSGHSFLRMIVLTLQFLYMFVNFIFSYVALANYFLAYYLLSESFINTVRDPNATTNGTDAPWGYPKSAAVNLGLVTIFSSLRSVYILSICTTFIAALGNRPQGARYIYLFAICLFAFITGIMIYLVIISVAKDVDGVLATIGWNSLIWLDPRGLRLLQTVISISLTYGVYVISSLLYREPWHLLLCIVQYLFLLPTYVNVLQIYAYCNISDVSWGTKGDNAASSTDVQIKTDNEGRATAEIELPSQHHSDVAAAYQQAVQALRARSAMLRERGSLGDNSRSSLSLDDYFKQFRTVWVLVWILINGTLIVVLMAPKNIGITSPNVGSIYLTGLFIAVAVLSLIRFFGSVMYLLSRGICGMCRSRGKARSGNPPQTRAPAPRATMMQPR